MACNFFRASSGEVATTTSAKSLLILTPLTVAAWLETVRVSFKGVTAGDAPILCEIGFYDGVGTSTEATPVKVDTARAESLLVRYRHTVTAEPSTFTAVIKELVHPQSHRTWHMIHDIGHRIPMPAGSRWGLRVTAGTSVNAVVDMSGEE